MLGTVNSGVRNGQGHMMTNLRVCSVSDDTVGALGEGIVRASSLRLLLQCGQTLTDDLCTRYANSSILVGAYSLSLSVAVGGSDFAKGLNVKRQVHTKM